MLLERVYLAIPMTPGHGIRWRFSAHCLGLTYRKPASHQRFQSASTARDFLGRDHRCRRARQSYAITNPISFLFSTNGMLCGEGITYAQNALGSDQLDELVRHGRFDVSLAVRLEVA